MNLFNQTVYVYWVKATNTPSTQECEGDQPPLIIRLSPNAIQAEQGREVFTQNMSYTPCQVTPHKNGKKKKNTRAHKPRPKPQRQQAQPAQTDNTLSEAVPQAGEQKAWTPDHRDEDKTPRIRTHIPLLQEGACELLKQYKQLKGEPEAQTVEPPPTSEAPGKAKTTPTGHKQTNNKRPAWQSAAARPPATKGRTNTKPASKALTGPNQT